jgi:hypothetical protein
LQVGGGNKAASSSTRVGNQWKCSSCSIALGPQAVVQGNAIILEGKLICVDCVKSGNRKAKQKSASNSIIYGGLAVLVLMLAGGAMFFPGQVLLLAMLASIGAILIGVLGFTLATAPRLGLVLLGVAGIGLSGWGLTRGYERAMAKPIEDWIAADSKEVEDLLGKDCIMEAQLRLSSIEQKSKTPAGIYLSKEARSNVELLHKKIDDWVQQKFGDLSADNRALLMQLFSTYGSRTVSGVLHYSVFKLSGTDAEITARFDPPNDVEEGKRPPSKDSNATDPVLEKAKALAGNIFHAKPELETMVLKIETAASPQDIKEYKTFNLTRKTLDAWRRGETSPTGNSEAPQK